MGRGRGIASPRRLRGLHAGVLGSRGGGSTLTSKKTSLLYCHLPFSFGKVQPGRMGGRPVLSGPSLDRQVPTSLQHPFNILRSKFKVQSPDVQCPASSIDVWTAVYVKVICPSRINHVDFGVARMNHSSCSPAMSL